MKVGDTVIRISREHCGMKKGDTATIKKLQGIKKGTELVELYEFPGGHNTARLKVIKVTENLTTIINSIVNEIKRNK